MPHTFPTTEHLRINRGAAPFGPRPTPSSACSVREETDLGDKRAGPGGPARTRGSAPQFMQSSQFREKYVALGCHPAPQQSTPFRLFRGFLAFLTTANLPQMIERVNPRI